MLAGFSALEAASHSFGEALDNPLAVQGVL